MARRSWHARWRPSPALGLIRLQCYEGLDESKALYEWNYRKQLLRIQADEGASAGPSSRRTSSREPFLLARPLLAAIRADEPVVLLIDEVDRVEVEAEALMLEVLADFQVTIPELGTMTATRRPMVFLTSNDTRDLSEARRRCLYLHIDYPPRSVSGTSCWRACRGCPRTSRTRWRGWCAPCVSSTSRSDLPSPKRSTGRAAWCCWAWRPSRREPPETLHVLLKYEADIEKARLELTGQRVAPVSTHVDAFRAPKGRPQ